MENKNVINHIKDNWVAYVLIFQIITSFVMNSADHIEFKKDIAELQSYNKDQQITLSEIKSRLASIDTNLEYLKRVK